ncbi:hypothetical protein T01_1083 [Trichinella spiralis]|uniref:Transmembrane protein n=1 Tax=Trichinella spiralis TaxID=6334 RepID=A0A0V1B4S1_TRISP|nr:hypothetical protein T01_1083 [Trichinella spiralis]
MYIRRQTERHQLVHHMLKKKKLIFFVFYFKMLASPSAPMSVYIYYNALSGKIEDKNLTIVLYLPFSLMCLYGSHFWFTSSSDSTYM